jgi:hypothetical protein
MKIPGYVEWEVTDGSPWLITAYAGAMWAMWPEDECSEDIAPMPHAHRLTPEMKLGIVVVEVEVASRSGE